MDEFFKSDTTAIIGFLTCGAISFLFSGAETAITGLGSLKAKHILDTKGEKAKELNLWLQHPSRVLTTILLFNTAVNILASALATEYAHKYFDDQALAIATGFTTIFILIFSEIIPKTIGKIYTETLALPAMKFIHFFYRLSFPLVLSFSYIASRLIESFGGGKHQPGPQITEEELEFLVNVGEKAGVFEETKQDMISGVFDFDEIKVREIMTPRTDMTAIELKTPLREAVKLAYESGHARIPVYDERIDNVVGILLAKDLLQFAATPEKLQSVRIQHLMRKAHQVPESKLIMDVFKELKRTKTHMAIVIDEYGGTAGLITLEDMLEEIVGEIQDEHDEDDDGVPGVETEEGIMVPSSISLRDLYNEYDVKIPLNDNYSTLTGFLLEHLGNNFPRKGQLVFWDGFSFELTRVKNYEIKEVKIKSVDGEQHIYKKGGEEESETSSSSKSGSPK